MKILIATDGSEFSRAAIEKACEMVIKPDSSVKIISVFEDFANASAEPFAISAEYIQEMNDFGHRTAAEFAANAINIIRGYFPDQEINIASKVDKGSASKAIVEEAEDWGADLIVVGSHGYGFWSRAFLGSVSQAVVHHAPCSVMIVKKKK